MEKFDGRVPEWGILNNNWPAQKIDLLTCTRRSLSYVASTVKKQAATSQNDNSEASNHDFNPLMPGGNKKITHT